jgi:hypothetical protein
VHALAVKAAAVVLAAGAGLTLHQKHEAHEAHLSHLQSVGQVETTVATTANNIPGFSNFYTYAGLEALWEYEGGPASEAPTAACIATRESGGQTYALSPTNDYGLWQINGSHGSLATYNPYGNARSAVIISNYGRNWSPWTTHSYCGV